MIKIYLIIGLVVALLFGGFLLRDSAQRHKIENLEGKVITLEKDNQDHKDKAAKQELLANQANARASTLTNDNEVIKREADKLRACIADKSCGIRVQFKYIEAPRLSGDNAHTVEPRLDESPRGYGVTLESWYIDLLEGIRLNKKQIGALQAELLARSQPDYCRLKP